jgi:hypothetical protein
VAAAESVDFVVVGAASGLRLALAMSGRAADEHQLEAALETLRVLAAGIEDVPEA